MALTFEPETNAALRARRGRAMDHVHDARQDAANPETAAARDRDHVFDFAAGVRVIVSVEQGGPIVPVALHVSMSYHVVPGNPTTAAQIVAAGGEALRCLGIGGQPAAVHRSPCGVFHWWFDMLAAAIRPALVQPLAAMAMLERCAAN